MSNIDIVCIPVKLQAFVVTEDYGESQYRVAPLIQPDYGALRAESGLIQHDVFDELEISEANLTARCNTRFMEVTTGNVRKERLGVYLSWCLPKTYRAGIVASKAAVDDHGEAMLRKGYTPRMNEKQELQDDPESLQVSEITT